MKKYIYIAYFILSCLASASTFAATCPETNPNNPLFLRGYAKYTFEISGNKYTVTLPTSLKADGVVPQLNGYTTVPYVHKPATVSTYMQLNFSFLFPSRLNKVVKVGCLVPPDLYSTNCFKFTFGLKAPSSTDQITPVMFCTVVPSGTSS